MEKQELFSKMFSKHDNCKCRMLQVHTSKKQ